MTVKKLRRLLKDKPKNATVLLGGYEFGHAGRGVHIDMVNDRLVYHMYDEYEPDNKGEEIKNIVVLL